MAALSLLGFLHARFLLFSVFLGATGDDLHRADRRFWDRRHFVGGRGPKHGRRHQCRSLANRRGRLCPRRGARARALQNGQPATLYVNSVAPGCGASAVAWAVVQSAAAVSCVSATDFSARFHGATMQSNFTQVIYAPTGLASNTFDGTAQFSSVNAAGAPATVTVYAGGSVAVVGD